MNAGAGATRLAAPGHWRRRLRAWGDAHLYSGLSSLGRLAQRPGATLLTVGVIALALALPLALALLLENLDRLSGSFREARELSVFLDPALDPGAMEAARDAAARLAAVEAVALRTPAQGLEEFRAMSQLAGAVELLDYNPLPAVLVVTPVPGHDAVEVAAQLEGLPGADFVQHDALWRTRLGAWLALGRQATWLAALLFGAGVLLVVGNTVRLDIQGRAEEIRIVQLLGATDGFVRRPFLYLGVWYGALAAVLACALALGAVAQLQPQVGALVASYGSQFVLQGVGAREAALLFAAAILLGWSGAWLAATHQLRQARAEAAR